MNVKQSAQNTAKKIARENLEFLKSARNQIAPVETQQPTSVDTVQIDQNLGQNLDPQLKAKIESDSKQALARLEEELKQLRIKREKQIEQSREEIVNKVEQKPAEVVVPKGKMRKIFGGMQTKLKQVAGKREMQKNVSG